MADAAGRAFDSSAARDFIDALWEAEIVPELERYIAIPCKSPMFDPEWQANGFMEAAVQQIAAWCRARQIPGLELEVVRLEGRTPLIFMAIPGSAGAAGDTVLLYGHLDKQPEMTGWREELGPWLPVRQGDRLYGRGGADDGYAAYASLTALEALHRFGGVYGRAVVLIEASEESGSPDLPAYIDALAERIGPVSLVVCLDAGAGNYEQLWSTTSLRGIAGGRLDVEILEEGVHSGDASGIVASSFRILRRLLSRLEDEATGAIHLASANAAIPEARATQAKLAAQQLGPLVHEKFPFVAGARAMGEDLAELILNRTWRPALSITGQAGLPDIASAGNVLRAATSAVLSLRLPPTADPARVNAEMAALLTDEPPYGARVSVDFDHAAAGWHAPALAPWLEAATEAASLAHFGRPACYMGEGGSIPFMGLLGEKFPEAQFLITGVLGPQSNAHGPNEFLEIAYAKKLNAAVADILMAHALRPGG
jgi:acetylornithine deacetylase/succinyl-diaminopimelate desuccinylase-like protein